RAHTPTCDRVRGATTPATARVRHRSTSFRTPRGRVGTLVPHNIRWRTLHTLRWRTLHTYDGERSTHTMANAPHIRWRTLHTYDGESSTDQEAEATHITSAHVHYRRVRT